MNIMLPAPRFVRSFRNRVIIKTVEGLQTDGNMLILAVWKFTLWSGGYYA
jgi:hypothetical protein